MAKHDAWLAVEYHARVHETTGRAPRVHWLEQVEHLRPLPAGKSLDDVFLHRELRTVRNDGTVRFDGGYLEVCSTLLPGSDVELRFDPVGKDVLPRVFINDVFYCDTVPRDLLANAHRARRDDAAPVPALPPSGLDPLALIEAEHRQYTRPLTAALTPEDLDDEADDAPEA